MENKNPLTQNDDNLVQLELPLLLNKLGEFVYSPYGIIHLNSLSVLQDRKLIQIKLIEVSEMVGLIEADYGIPIGMLPDICSFLERTKPSEAFLEAAEINQIKVNLDNFNELKVFIKYHREDCPNLARYGDRIHSHTALVKEINATIDPKGAIREDASRELRKIKVDIQHLENEKKNVLTKVLKRYSEFSQDDIVTMRDGRIVLGIQPQFVSRINGVVHGTSATGATVFIEPMETLRLSNQIQNLRIEERKEIIRILRFLTGLIREIREDIYYSIDNFGVLDFIHAKAKLAIQMKAFAPQVVDKPMLNLFDARHPILILKDGYDRVIPLTLNLGENFQTLVITGPNAGGKTVALKTIGLLSIMAQIGLHVPAHPDSKISILDSVLVNIGDRQNIEQDLSTFSANIIRLQEILKKATNRSLILLDEVGTGTDPKEGSALAIALIKELTNRKSLSVATTHHGELKAFAFQTKGVENGSMEFNIETLQPTYRLQIGIPGSSYAFEIAKRYGFSASVLKQAQKILGSEKGELEKLLLDLNKRLQQSETDSKELSINISKTKALKELYENEMQKLRKEKLDLRREAAEEAHQILDKTNATIEKIVKELRNTQASKQSIREAHQNISELKGIAQDILKDTLPEKKNIDEFHPGDIVWIESMREEGEITSDPNSENKVWILVNDIRLEVSTLDLKKISKSKAENIRVYK
jgi:DNA mismatch repair protein MutS2